MRFKFTMEYAKQAPKNERKTESWAYFGQKKYYNIVGKEFENKKHDRKQKGKCKLSHLNANGRFLAIL